MLATPQSMPYETVSGSTRPQGFVAGCLVLAGLTILELLAFTVGAPFSIAAAYLWFALGLFSFSYLCWSYISAILSDLRHGALWGLLPVAAAIPLCFFNIESFTFINTESLSELEDTYAKFQQPNRAYTEIFWATYPARSLVLNLIPTALFGISPWSYRVGFSYPIFFGVLFFFAGIRRYHRTQVGASAVAGLAATCLFSYPMFCQISRMFEMAISSVSFGMWAIGGLLLFAAQPTAITALVAAWAIGLLSASFTSGLGLVALLWLLLAMWMFRAWRRGDRKVAGLVAAVLAYCVVVGVALYVIRPYTLRVKQIPFSDMLNYFYEALHYTLSFSKPVFTAPELVVPSCVAILFALSLRGGWLPLILVGWCFPVIWSATNLHGKIGPQLPFALYRSLIIIPVVLYVMALTILWGVSRFGRFRGTRRVILLCLTVSLYFPIMNAYTANHVLVRPRALEGREVITYEILRGVEKNGLSPFQDGWIADRTEEKRVEHFIDTFKYFLLNWKRISRGEPIPQEMTEAKKPGVIVTMRGDPVVSEDFPGYHKDVLPITTTNGLRAEIALSAIILRPE